MDPDLRPDPATATTDTVPALAARDTTPSAPDTLAPATDMPAPVTAPAPGAGTHKLLRRQLRRAGIARSTPTEAQWHAFLQRVDRAYHEADQQVTAIGRTLAVSSKEMAARLEQVQQHADDRVAAERKRLELVVGSVTTALVMFDRVGRIVAVNPEAERLLGDHHDVVDRHLEDVLMIEGRDGIRRPLLARADLDDVLRQGHWERHDVPLHARPMTTSGDGQRAASSIAADIDDVSDATEHVDHCDALDDAFLTDTVTELHVHGQADDPAETELEITATCVSIDVVVVPFADDDHDLGGLVALTDNAERERARERLSWQSSHDPLTGLVNRAQVTERIDMSLQQAGRSGEWPSVLFLDLDRFKPVNDLLGHAFGDRLLVAAAERLEQCVRSADTVARLGGDEFVILCENAGDTAMVCSLADRILQAMAEPFHLAGEQTLVTASIGIAHAGPMYQSADALLHDADLAMYGAKERGRNCYEVADEQSRVKAAERVLLERGLRSAIARREIGVVYQPVQNTMTGELMGFEALARWVHPVLGDVRPYRFVPVALETGLIQALGDRMLDLACRDVATWNRERKTVGLPPIVVHVNISGRELLSPNLLTRVRDALRRHAVLPSWIMLEMTETMLLDDPETALERLRELKRAGIRVAIDDFGTGYSSLAYLRKYPVHMVKIDREFIAEIASSKQDQAIVKSMIDLAHGLDHEVLAEGVETSAELEVLRNLGCGLVQGFLLGMPMPSEEALLLATSSRTRTPDQAPSASVEMAHLQPQP